MAVLRKGQVVFRLRLDFWDQRAWRVIFTKNGLTLYGKKSKFEGIKNMDRLYYRWWGRVFHDRIDGIIRTACCLLDYMLYSELMINSRDIILPQRARTKKEVTE